jgi:hypothetical protein
MEENKTDEIEMWDNRLFNWLEWFSYLVNEKQIKNKKLIRYFEDVIKGYYDI